MDALKISTVLLAASFILGCSPGKNKDAPPAATAPPAHPATVFDPLTRQLERARDVQNTVDQNNENTRKAVEGQERGDSPP